MKPIFYLTLILFFMSSCSRYNYIPRAQSDLVKHESVTKDIALSPLQTLQSKRVLPPKPTTSFSMDKKVQMNTGTQLTFFAENITLERITQIPSEQKKIEHLKFSVSQTQESKYSGLKIGFLLSLLALVLSIILMMSEASIILGAFLFLIAIFGLVIFPIAMLVTFIADQSSGKKGKTAKEGKSKSKNNPDNDEVEASNDSNPAKPHEKKAKNRNNPGWAWLFGIFLLSNFIMSIIVKLTNNKS